MQTFLPYPDMCLSLDCLDNQRLNKQRLEALTIYKILKEGEYSNHLVVKMWKGHLSALARYYNLSLAYWKQRGYKNTLEALPCPNPIIFPVWWGDKAFHRSHQSNLLRKDEEHYRPYFGTTVPKNLEYIWPIK